MHKCFLGQTQKGFGLLIFCTSTLLFFALFLASEQCSFDQHIQPADIKKAENVADKTESGQVGGIIVIGDKRFSVKPMPSEGQENGDRSNCKDIGLLLNFAKNISNPLIAIATMFAVYFAFHAWLTSKADLAQNKKVNTLQLQPYLSIVDFDWRWQTVRDGITIQPNIAIKFINKGSTPITSVERVTIDQASINTPRRYADGYLADPAHPDDYKTYTLDHNHYRITDWVVNPYALAKFDYLAPDEMQPIMMTVVLKDSGENTRHFGAVEKIFIQGSIHFYDISTGPDEIRICDFEISDDNWDFQRWFEKFRGQIGDDSQPQRKMSRITGDRVVPRDREYEKKRDRQYAELMAHFDPDNPAGSN